jgi:ArsR family transcriptional regulator
MLAMARANLEGANFQHCQVRYGDIYNLSVPTGFMDVVTIHHVLHFLDDPAAVVAEAARTLRPGGRLLIADFAPHTLEFLRTDYSHRRLGFADKEVTTWCETAGLVNTDVRHLRVAGKRDKEKLTVSLWTSTQHQNAPTHRSLEVA